MQLTDLFDLRGRVVIVTGSTRGIGLAIVRHAALRGARVAVSSRKPDACERARDVIVAEGGEAIAVPCDVAKREDLERLVATTLATWGTIDALICNAAVNPHYGPTAGIEDDAFDKIINSNVRSTMWLCRMARPHLAKNGGSIVLLSSIAGIAGSRTIGTYGVSKAALGQLARNLAVEWGPSGIRVNAIAPGIVKTDFAKPLYADPATERATAKAYPLGRLGEPDDIAGVALMLVSAAGAFVTGQTIVVDGGATIAGFD